MGNRWGNSGNSVRLYVQILGIRNRALVLVKGRRRKSQFKDALSSCFMKITGVSSHWIPSEECGEYIPELATDGQQREILIYQLTLLSDLRVSHTCRTAE